MSSVTDTVRIAEVDGPAWEDLLDEVLTDEPESAGLSFIRSVTPGEGAYMYQGGGCSGGGSHTSSSPNLNSGYDTGDTIACGDCGGCACY